MQWQIIYEARTGETLRFAALYLLPKLVQTCEIRTTCGTNVGVNSVGYVPCCLIRMSENQEENKGKKSKIFNKNEWRRRKYSKKYKRKFH
jgi:hypothetical protein